MYEYLINEYIKKLTIQDITDFGLKNNINISIEDSEVLLYYAKNNYKELISSNPNSVLKEIKKRIDPITYEKAYNLFLIYRNNYLN